MPPSKYDGRGPAGFGVRPAVNQQARNYGSNPGMGRKQDLGTMGGGGRP